ncbi:hypothetical protein ACFC6L_25170 [Kitasatospora phosalacinea]|uniref:hypothetical protein n=1 Tax=Kitasatospora phosalacinea TaxID=2065 RepID=UPI0035E064DB
MELFASLLLAPATWTALLVLLVLAVGAARDRRRLRVAALVLSGAAVLVLSQSLLRPVVDGVTSAEEGGTASAPPWPCRIDGKPAEQVVDYRVDLFPVVGFSCVLADGSAYDTGRVPARATPLTAALAVLAGGTLYASRRRPGA